MPISVVVADTHVHAKAMISWIKLDPKIWIPIHYGQSIQGNYFENARIVRPAGGITVAHLAWIEVELMPSLSGKSVMIPSLWIPDRECSESDPLGFASMWAR